MSLVMESSSSSLNQQSKLGNMDDHHHHHHKHGDDDNDDGHVVLSSCSSDDNDDGVSSVVSSDSDLFGEEEEEDEISSGSSSSPTSPSSGSNSSSSSCGQQLANGPLQDMSSLLQELPFKRGLSKHYNGKSQSFTSLANVRCLEDLAKPENPYNKRLKSCKSYGLLESYRSSQPHRSASSSRLISKKASRGSCLSLNIRRNGSFLRPPIPPPHRSASTTSFTNQTPPLFA